MKKTYEELEAEVKKGYEFSSIMNRKILEMLKTQKELETKYQEEIAALQCERDGLLESLSQLQLENHELEERTQAPPLERNSRKAGRKKVANHETVELVMTLRETGVSYVKISQVLEERLGVKLGRTTIGEIVRGTYTPLAPPPEPTLQQSEGLAP
ncbi:MAG: hypothetical protein R3Y07_04210 [Eubacteriales bacterium]